MSRPETTVFRWAERAERFYVDLYERSGHWTVEWGTCDPPKSQHYVQAGKHETSVRDEAVDLMLQHIREVAPEPDEVERVRPRLAEALEQVSLGES